MSYFKYTVIFIVINILSKSAESNANSQQYVRNYNPPLQPLYNYPNNYPYQGLPIYQSPIPYQLPYYGAQPINIPYRFPSYQYPNYPFSNIHYPLYNSYPMYAPYQPYPPYPYYPTYPTYQHQANLQNYPDPYAHIPSEIIDIDTNATVDPEFLFNDMYKNTVSSSNYNNSEPIIQKTGYVVTSNTVTSKPVQAVITRNFGSSFSDPVVNVQISNSAPGSGVLIDANDIDEDVDNELEEDEEEKVEEEEEEDEEDNEEEGGLFSFG